MAYKFLPTNIRQISFTQNVNDFNNTLTLSSVSMCHLRQLLISHHPQFNLTNNFEYKYELCLS